MENVHGVIVHLSVLGTLVKIWGGRRGRVPAMVVGAEEAGVRTFSITAPWSRFWEEANNTPFKFTAVAHRMDLKRACAFIPYDVHTNPG